MQTIGDTFISKLKFETDSHVCMQALTVQRLLNE